MLFALHMEVARRLVGKSPASFFESVTGLNRMNYQRGRSYEAVVASLDRVKAHADTVLEKKLKKRHATDAEIQQIKAEMPNGASALAVYGMGLLGEECTAATRDILESLDASDMRLCMARGGDPEGLAVEIGSSSDLGSDYCAPLEVAGLRSPSFGSSEEERAAMHFLLKRRAHMALSFLAAVDHETGQWNRRTIGSDVMNGRPRFAVLLAESVAGSSERQRPMDPIACLVDFIGAAGHRVRTGEWPRAVPSLVKMGERVELSAASDGDGSRFVRGLRSGKHPMTRAAFRTLVRSQLWGPGAPSDVLDCAADLLEPYLVAAHTLTLLMPERPEVKGHLDRAGWREAYLSWWERHACRYPPPKPSQSDPPPAWLLRS